jgi:signal peptidase I
LNPQTPNTAPVTPDTTPSQVPESDNGSLFERIMSHWFVSWILIPAALIFFLHYYIFSAYHVVGSSMIPTLHDSDYLIISKVDNTIASVTGKNYYPKRGEIIVFHYPKQPDLDFVKRVVGLPGDRITIKNGKVTVYNADNPNGYNPDSTHQINGNYTQGDVNDNPVNLTVPDGNLFVLGDNRAPEGSSDSREWGFLPSKNIVGNVVLRLFPFDTIKTF